MDTAESRRLDAYEGGSTNAGAYYGGQPQTSANQPPPGVGERVPSVGQRVRHRISGETGQVTGAHVHGHTGERFAMVRWDGQPSKGFTQDQGYSLDNLTTP